MRKALIAVSMKEMTGAPMKILSLNLSMLGLCIAQHDNLRK